MTASQEDREDQIAVYDHREHEFVMVGRQEAIDGVMRYAATLEPGTPVRAVVEKQALAMARFGAFDDLAVANFWMPAE